MNLSGKNNYFYHVFKLLQHIGEYFILLWKVFQRPEKISMYREQTMREIVYMGINSLPLVIIISFFMGAVIVIQTSTNVDSPFIPKYLIGFAARQSIILEFSSTMLGLILIGKIGSNIATQIGTMRVTDQIDALDIMGINSSSYLILPKIVAMLVVNPILMTICMFTGIYSGLLAGTLTGLCDSDQYIIGVRYDFQAFGLIYAYTKSLVFGFIIATIPGYFGYFVKGGAVEVGKASTSSVIYTSIVMLILNYVLTQVMLL